MYIIDIHINYAITSGQPIRCVLKQLHNICDVPVISKGMKLIENGHTIILHKTARNNFLIIKTQYSPRFQIL